jgi:Sigma-70, region 4
MASLETLPPDQRAVLQLLLKQGKSYDDIAGILRIDADAVRARAMDALDALGPEEISGLTPDRQDEIGDYLLGQQSASQRAETRGFLGSSAAGRAYARVVAGELRPLAGDELPDIPADGAEVVETVAPPEATAAPQARTSPRERRPQRSSRLGGALLLVGLGLVVAVILAFVLSSGGSDSSNKSTNAPAASTTTQAKPKVEAQINLIPPGGPGKNKPLGVVQVLSQGSQRGMSLAVQGLDQKTAYGVWLTNSRTDAKFLGFAPAVDKNGRMVTASGLPADAAKYKNIVMTAETQRTPKQPGKVVLSGALNAGA